MSAEDMLVVGTGLLNFGGLVWGASKLATKLEALSKAFEEERIKITTIENKVSSHDTEIARLWDGHERRTGERRTHD